MKKALIYILSLLLVLDFGLGGAFSTVKAAEEEYTPEDYPDIVPDIVISYFDMDNGGFIPEDIDTDYKILYYGNNTKDYTPGTYIALDDSKAVNIYTRPDETSQVKLTAPADATHIIEEFRYDFGYVSYNGTNGWVKMDTLTLFTQSDTDSSEPIVTDTDTDSTPVSPTDTDTDSTPVSPTDTDTDKPIIPDDNTQNYKTGTYVAKDDSKYINIYTEPDETSQIKLKAPGMTFHIIHEFRFDFGYVNYNGTYGWVKMDTLTLLTQNENEQFVNAANRAIDSICASYQYFDYCPQLYQEFQRMLSEGRESLVNGSSAEVMEQISKKASELTQDFTNAVTYIESIQQGDYKLPPNFRLYGDINNDSVVNMLDVTAMQRCIANLESFSALDKSAADVDGDSELGMTDIVNIQQYLAKLKNLFSQGLLFHLTGQK